VIVSTDNGLSWQERGAVNVPKDSRTYDEHMIIERKDGSLWMLVRTNYGIGESISKDMGKSWSKLSPSKIEHPSARFFIRRLGNLLLVKHGPIDIKTQRSHLMAFISKDDGKSWTRGLLIDQRKGVSYPDGQEDENGTIHIIFDYNRVTNQNIFITSFTENDILANDYDKRIIKDYTNIKTVSTRWDRFLIVIQSIKMKLVNRIKKNIAKFELKPEDVGFNNIFRV
jgi:BNR repeat protein